MDLSHSPCGWTWEQNFWLKGQELSLLRSSILSLPEMRGEPSVLVLQTTILGRGWGVFVTFYYEPQSIVWKKMSCVERTSVSRARNVLRSPDKIILQGGKGITQGGQHSWGTHIAMQVLDSLPTIPLENKSPRWPLRDHTTALTRQSEKKGFVCVRKIGTCGLEWNFQHRTQVQGVL